MNRRSHSTPAAASAAQERAPEPGARQLMLDTAEKLFAQEGVEGVTLMRIVQDSGQRNRSALHYHFGSRAELVAHVINMRMPVVNARRHQELDLLEARPEGHSVRDLMLATAGVLAAVMDEEPWGRDYLRILMQANFNPQICRFDLIPLESTSGLRRVRRLVARQLESVPAAILDERLVWVEDTVVMTLGRLARTGGTAAGTNVLHNLVDHCTGALQASVSAAARGPRESAAFADTRHVPALATKAGDAADKSRPRARAVTRA